MTILNIGLHINLKLNLKLFSIAVILLSTILSSCSDRPEQSVSLKQKTKSKVALAQEQESAKQAQLEYGDIWTQEKSEYVIIPVGYKIKSKKRVGSYSDAASGSNYFPSRSSILRGQSLAAVNLMFHNHQQDGTHLLLDRRAFITKFDYLVDSQTTAAEIEPSTTVSSCQPPKKTPADHRFHQLMMYQIIEQDTNQDRTLNSEDANRGYLSDLTGKNLRSLNPDLTRLAQWHCDYQRNKLLLFVEELNPQAPKEFEPLALYIYDLATSKFDRLSLPQSNLENWKISLNDGSMYLYSRLDTNGDRQYNSADETRVIKYNLDTKQTIEINNPQIRQLLTQE